MVSVGDQAWTLRAPVVDGRFQISVPQGRVQLVARIAIGSVYAPYELFVRMASPNDPVSLRVFGATGLVVHDKGFVVVVPGGHPTADGQAIAAMLASAPVMVARDVEPGHTTGPVTACMLPAAKLTAPFRVELGAAGTAHCVVHTSGDDDLDL